MRRTPAIDAFCRCRTERSLANEGGKILREAADTARALVLLSQDRGAWFRWTDRARRVHGTRVRRSPTMDHEAGAEGRSRVFATRTGAARGAARDLSRLVMCGSA